MMTHFETRLELPSTALMPGDVVFAFRWPSSGGCIKAYTTPSVVVENGPEFVQTDHHQQWHTHAKGLGTPKTLFLVVRGRYEVMWVESASELRVDDRIVEFEWTGDGHEPRGPFSARTSQGCPTVTSNEDGLIMVDTHPILWHAPVEGTIRLHVIRQRGTPELSEWPSQCPRCARPASAVVLFTSFECRHGCHL